ncbi:MAG: hypothetical protein IJ467_00615 [Bacteroidaceae bacterium]|nr:hypothetical protein [Bacteroidaceae bacterium]
MAKRRELKKEIHRIFDAILWECILTSCIKADVDKEKLAQIEVKTLEHYCDLLCRVSHTQPGEVKVFYKKLRADMAKATSEIFEEISNLHS